MREGWQQARLGDLVRLQYGKALPDADRVPGGVPVAGSAGQFAEHDRGNATTDHATIVVGRKGTAGSVTYFPSPVWVTDTAYWAEPLTGIDLRLMTLILLHADLPAVCAQTGVPGLNRERAYEIPVLVPTVREQQRIVDLMGAVDDAIAKASVAADAASRTYAARGAQIRSGEGATQFLSGLVTKARSGATPSRKRPELYGGEIPWVKSGEVAGELILSTSETITDEALQASSAWLVPAGAVLVAMYGATAAQVGRLGIPAATNQAVLALLPNEEKVDGDFLYHLLRSDSVRLKSLATGAAQPNLSKGVIMRQEYAIPPMEQQRRLGQEMTALMDVEHAAHHLTESLKELRMSLLTALLSGDHEIPASYDALLEAGA